ncbi:helix-turn-helix domain-containing protein [Streptomyces sp. BH104]|uniref:helix-turn-helix domain-containing protein n=1 Tax=Streptomyces sp. BH104 TaxID=3410407 RepID=UPI003BB64C19
MTAPDGIGTLLRTAREQQGLDRRQVADMIGAILGEPVDPDNVKRWELERRLPIPRWHRSIGEALGITVEDIARAVSRSRAHRHQLKAAVPSGEEASSVKRRTLLAGGVATVAAASAGALPGLAEAHDDINAALSGSDAEDITYLESVFERNAGGYRGRPPEQVLSEIDTDLQLLRQVLKRPHTARDRAQLVRTAAGITGLIAIIQHDGGAARESDRWFNTAARAARESGDRQMLAWVLARHAMVGLNYGAPAAAAERAVRAQRAAGSTPSAAAALASAVSARALASLGTQRAAARQAIARTEGIAEQLDSQGLADTWFGYPEQKHHVHLSQAYTLLGDTTSARREQQQALKLTTSPSVMTRALLGLDDARCMRVDGDHQDAAEKALGVWQELPAGFRSGLVRTRAELVRDGLSGRHHAALDEALRA